MKFCKLLLTLGTLEVIHLPLRADSMEYTFTATPAPGTIKPFTVSFTSYDNAPDFHPFTLTDGDYAATLTKYSIASAGNTDCLGFGSPEAFVNTGGGIGVCGTSLLPHPYPQATMLFIFDSGLPTSPGHYTDIVFHGIFLPPLGIAEF